MKVFDTISHDGAIEVRDIAPGHVFTPRSCPEDVYLCVGGFSGSRASLRVFDSNGQRVDFHFMGDLRAGVNVESGALVLFYPNTKVIPLPSYLTTGKYEP